MKQHAPPTFSSYFSRVLLLLGDLAAIGQQIRYVGRCGATTFGIFAAGGVLRIVVILKIADQPISAAPFKLQVVAFAIDNTSAPMILFFRKDTLIRNVHSLF
jgi:hypothetical protein